MKSRRYSMAPVKRKMSVNYREEEAKLHSKTRSKSIGNGDLYINYRFVNYSLTQQKRE